MSCLILSGWVVLVMLSVNVCLDETEALGAFSKTSLITQSPIHLFLSIRCRQSTRFFYTQLMVIIVQFA